MKLRVVRTLASSSPILSNEPGLVRGKMIDSETDRPLEWGCRESTSPASIEQMQITVEYICQVHDNQAGERGDASGTSNIDDVLQDALEDLFMRLSWAASP